MINIGINIIIIIIIIYIVLWDIYYECHIKISKKSTIFIISFSNRNISGQGMI
jgi:hypothetical protein